MIERFILDNLHQDGVSVKKQNFIVYQEKEYPAGDIWRRLYVNSERGRMQIVNELPQAQSTAILTVWGDTPTVSDDINVL